MALEVGRLVAYLSVDSSGVDRGLAAAEKKMSGSGDRLAGMWSGATKAIGIVGTGLTGLAAASAGVGVKTAANLEQANIAFSTMLGSGQKAQGFLSDLNKFAAKTPFDFQGLQTAASSLISAGVDSKKVIPIMTSLGDVTAGMGTGSEGVQRATVALQQMSAAGKITGEDLNQLRDAGVPVFDLLAAATGKSKAEVAGLAQAGKLGSKELGQLMSALESGKGLERFSGLVDKQSQSLSGMMSTLKDTASMGLAQAFQPAIPFLKTILTDANTLLTSSLPGITAGVGYATTALQDFYMGFVHGTDAADGSQSEIAAWGTIVYGWVTSAASAVRDFYHGFTTGADDVDSSQSKFAGWGETVANAIGHLPGLFGQVKAALSGVDFSRIGDSLAAFGTAAGDSSAWMDSLKIGAALLGTALGFLSDHAGTIIKWMPAIVAGFAAWKLMQQGLMVLEIARIPLLAAQVAATFATAAANTAAAAANVYAANVLLVLNGVTRDCLVVRLKDAALANLQAIRTGVLTAATWLQATATRALGAAMAFATGPIGIAIAVIGLLVAAFIVAYKNSETFRDIVNGVWTSIQAGASWVVDWFTNTAWPAMKTAFQAIADAALWLWNNGIKPAWEGISAAVDLAIFLVKGYINAWVVVIQWLVDQVVDMKDRIVTNWGNLRDGIGAAVDWIRDKILSPFGTFVTVTVPGWFTASKDAVGRAWDAVKDKVSGPISWVMQYVFDPLKTALVDTIPGFFTSAVDGIGKAWDWLEDKAKTPVRFVIEKVINSGIIDTFDTVAKVFDKDHKSTPHVVVPFANGSEDHRAQIARPGAMRLWAEPETGGEAYIPLATGKRGRSTEILASVAKRFGYSLQRYANGGILGKAQGALSTVGSAIGGIVGAVSDPVGALTKAVSGLLGGLGSGPFADVLKAIPGKLIDLAKSSLGAVLGSGSGAASTTPAGAGVQRWAPQVLQALSIMGQPASLLQTTLRRMNQESGGNPSIVNRTDVNWQRGTPSVGLMQVIGPTYRSNVPKAFDRGPYLYGTSTDPMANILASMHYAIGRYGSLASAYNKAGGYATGTLAATKGLHMVGERGPELINFRGGERVYTNRETAQMTQPKVEKHLHYYAATGRSMPQDDFMEAAQRVQMITTGW